MYRYLRLYLHFLRFSFSRAMEFRVDFGFRIVMDVFYYAVNIAFFRLIYAQTDTLGGWSEPQVMVFVGCFLLLDALSMTLLANNLYELPLLINRGDLDYYLVRPVSALFVLSLRDFAANSFVNLLMAAGLLAYYLSRLDDPLTLTGLVLLIGSLAAGFALRYLVHLLTIIPVFWWQRGQGLQMMYWHMARFIERPDRIYTGFARVVLTTVLPFALMASVPARFYLEPFDARLCLHVTLVLLAFSAVTALAWRAGLRAYSSASS